MAQHTTTTVPISGQMASTPDFDELLLSTHERFLETDCGELERQTLVRLAPLRRFNLRVYRGVEEAINDLLVSALDAGARIGYQLAKEKREGKSND